MIWAIKVVFCLLLTSLTGSIVFVFWYLLGQWLEKTGFVNILYLLMKYPFDSVGGGRVLCLIPPAADGTPGRTDVSGILSL